MADPHAEPRPCTILIADDEPSIRLLLRVTLEAEGHSVIEAEDGDRALQRARELRPDLVVLDVMMPFRTGIEVALELAGDDASPDVPIIMLTALATAEDIARGIEAGALHYLPKPFAPLDLVERVRHSLEVAREGRLADMRHARLEALRRHATDLH